MIGEPTNFVHTTHVGSGDMGLGLPSVGLEKLFLFSSHKPTQVVLVCFGFTCSKPLTEHLQVDLVQAQMKSKGGYVHGGSEGSQL